MDTNGKKAPSLTSGRAAKHAIFDGNCHLFSVTKRYETLSKPEKNLCAKPHRLWAVAQGLGIPALWNSLPQKYK